MNPGHTAFKCLALTALALCLTGLRCTPKNPEPPPPPPPEFESFGVPTDRICTNLGIPIIRIAWTVQGVGESCLSNLAINGSAVDGDFWAVGIQNGRCGEDDYSRETAFSLQSVFGNNIPSSITVSAELTRQAQAGVFVGTEVLDTASATVTAQECDAGFTPGG